MQANVSIRKDKVISVIDPVTMDVAIARQIIDIVVGHARKLRQNGENVYILVDVRQIEHDSEEVREVMFNGVKKVDFDRIAVLGVNQLQTKTINMLLLTAQIFKLGPNREKIRLFTDEQSAELWLQRP